MKAARKRGKKTGNRNFPALIPVELSDEEKEMFRRSDYTGLEYLHCQQIRQRRTRTLAQAKRLTEHDAEEERINRDPLAVMREAHKAIDRGTSLLLKLIRSGKLRHSIEPTEKGKIEGVKTLRWDEALNCLASRLSDLNRQLIRLAEDNAPKACWHIWFESKVLAEAFIRLGTLFPDEFRELAEDSLTMPSVRARNPKFTADAEAIIDALHLAEKHPTPNIWDNRSRVGAQCYLVVASIIERIHFERRQYEWEKEGVEGLKRFKETAERYRDVTLEEVLKSKLHPTRFNDLVSSSILPDWEKDSAAWWKLRVLPLVKQEFKQLAKTPNRNPALWAELKRGGERDTENDMRRYMEKICKNKFDQIEKTSRQ